MLTYSQIIVSTIPGKEALEIVGADNVLITSPRIWGGITCLRLNNCGSVKVVRTSFGGMYGKPDPDGQCVQIINPRGPHIFDHATFYSTYTASDLTNVFCDKPCTGSVQYLDCEWAGKGNVDFSSSCCMDGPYCVPVTVTNGSVYSSRCAFSIAGGQNHSINTPKLVACQNEIYIDNQYKAKAFGPFTVYGLPSSCLVVGPNAKSSDVIFKG